MINFQAVRSRVFEIGLLTASVAALAVTAPGAADALKAIIQAPLALAGLASASSEPAEPVAELVVQLLPAGSVQPFVFPASRGAERARAVHCLAEAVYYEAGFEPEPGQEAVAQVVLNRVRDGNFPDTVCGVVYQGWWRKTGCQFSFVCDGSQVRRPPGDDDWTRARAVADRALNGYVAVQVGSATHYHADYVNPYWSTSLTRISTVGAHTFYSWRGKAGQVTALNRPYSGEGEVGFWEAAAERNPRKFERADA